MVSQVSATIFWGKVLLNVLGFLVNSHSEDFETGLLPAVSTAPSPYTGLKQHLYENILEPWFVHFLVFPSAFLQCSSVRVYVPAYVHVCVRVSAALMNSAQC